MPAVEKGIGLYNKLGKSTEKVDVWGCFKQADYTVIKSIIESQGKSVVSGAKMRFGFENVVVPAGNASKTASNKTLLVERDGAGVIYISGLITDESADLKAIKTALLNKTLGGFAITNLAIKANTQEI